MPYDIQQESEAIKELINALDGLEKNTDKTGSHIEELREELKKIIDVSRNSSKALGILESVLASFRLRGLSVKGNISDIIKTFNNLHKTLNYTKGHFKNLDKELKTIKLGIGELSANVATSGDKVDKIINNINKKLSKLQKQLDKTSKTKNVFKASELEKQISHLDKIRKLLDGVTGSKRAAINAEFKVKDIGNTTESYSKMQEKIENIITDFERIDKTAKPHIVSVEKAIRFLDKRLDEVTKKLSEAAEIDDTKQVEYYRKQAKAISDVKDKMEDLTEVEQAELGPQIDPDKLLAVGKNVDEVTDKIVKQVQVIKEHHGSLEDMMSEMDEAGSIAKMLGQKFKEGEEHVKSFSSTMGGVPVGLSAVGVGIYMLIEKIDELGDSLNDTILEFANYRKSLAITKGQMVGIFPDADKELKKLRKEFDLSKRETEELAEVFVEFKDAAANIHNITEAMEGMRDVIGEVDIDRLRELVDLYKEIPEKQIEMTVQAEGDFDEQLNALLSLSESGNIGKVLKLSASGAFGKDIADAIGSTLDERTRKTIEASRHAQKIQEDIRDTVSNFLQGAWPQYLKLFSDLSLKVVQIGGGFIATLGAVKAVGSLVRTQVAAQDATTNAIYKTAGSNINVGTKISKGAVVKGATNMVGNVVVSMVISKAMTSLRDVIGDKLEKSGSENAKAIKEALNSGVADFAINAASFGASIPIINQLSKGISVFSKSLKTGKGIGTASKLGTAKLLQPLVKILPKSVGMTTKSLKVFGKALGKLAVPIDLLINSGIAAYETWDRANKASSKYGIEFSPAQMAESFLEDFSNSMTFGLSDYLNGITEKDKILSRAYGSVSKSGKVNMNENAINALVSEALNKHNIEAMKKAQNELKDIIMKEKFARQAGLANLEKTNELLKMISTGKYSNLERMNEVIANLKLERLSEFGGTIEGYSKAVEQGTKAIFEEYAKDKKALNQRRIEILKSADYDAETRQIALKQLHEAEMAVVQKFAENMLKHVGEYDKIPKVIQNNLRNKLNKLALNRMFEGELGGSLDLVYNLVSNNLQRSFKSFDMAVQQSYKELEQLNQEMRRNREEREKAVKENSKTYQNLFKELPKDLQKQLSGMGALSLDKLGDKSVKEIEEYQSKIKGKIENVNEEMEGIKKIFNFKGSLFGGKKVTIKRMKEMYKEVGELSKKGLIDDKIVKNFGQVIQNYDITPNFKNFQLILDTINTIQTQINARLEKRKSLMRKELDTVNKIAELSKPFGNIETLIIKRYEALNKVFGQLDELTSDFIANLAEIEKTVENAPTVLRLKRIEEIFEAGQEGMINLGKGADVFKKEMLNWLNVLNEQEKALQKAKDSLREINTVGLEKYINKFSDTMNKTLKDFEVTDEGKKFKESIKKYLDISKNLSTLDKNSEEYKKAVKKQNVASTNFINAYTKLVGKTKDKKVLMILETIKNEVLNTGVVAASGIEKMNDEITKKEAELKTQRTKIFDKFVSMIEESANTLNRKLQQQIEDMIDNTMELSSMEFDTNGIVKAYKKGYDAIIKETEEALEKRQELIKKAEEARNKLIEEARKKGTNVEAAIAQGNMLVAKARSEYAKTELEMKKKVAELAEKAYQYQTKRFDLAQDLVDTTMEQLEIVGAPFEKILELEQQSAIIARQKYDLAMEYLDNMIKAHADGKATAEDELKARIEAKRAENNLVKKTLGLQRSAMEKMMGQFANTINEIGGIKAPTKAMLFGAGRIQLEGQGGFVQGKLNKYSGGFKGQQARMMSMFGGNIGVHRLGKPGGVFENPITSNKQFMSKEDKKIAIQEELTDVLKELVATLKGNVKIDKEVVKKEQRQQTVKSKEKVATIKEFQNIFQPIADSFNKISTSSPLRKKLTIGKKEIDKQIDEEIENFNKLSKEYFTKHGLNKNTISEWKKIERKHKLNLSNLIAKRQSLFLDSIAKNKSNNLFDISATKKIKLKLNQSPVYKNLLEKRKQIGKEIEEENKTFQKARKEYFTKYGITKSSIEKWKKSKREELHKERITGLMHQERNIVRAMQEERKRIEATIPKHVNKYAGMADKVKVGKLMGGGLLGKHGFGGLGVNFGKFTLTGADYGGRETIGRGTKSIGAVRTFNRTVKQKEENIPVRENTVNSPITPMEVGKKGVDVNGGKVISKTPEKVVVRVEMEMNNDLFAKKVMDIVLRSDNLSKILRPIGSTKKPT